MREHTRLALISVLALALAVVAAGSARSQTLYLKGQNVQPAYEGFHRNPDGTFTMVFGYLNRNYEEALHIPVGPDNLFEPGPPDRGQPTHFYPRRQSFVFRVTVPADWGNARLIWTVTYNGRTSTASGNLMPVWELDPGVYKSNRNSGGNFGRYEKEWAENEPPSVRVVGNDAVTVTLPERLTLTVTASDDGQQSGRLSRRRRPRAGAPAAEPLRSVPRISGRSNPIGQNMVQASAAYETGLAVTWLHYRGRGTVTFEPRVAPIDSAAGGTAVTSVRFSEPGTYILRAVADDSVLVTSVNVTVVVKEAQSGGGP